MTQTIKFGTVTLSGDFAGKTFDDLPQILESAYDAEVPSDCEYIVDGEVADGAQTVEAGDSVIEIRAVAGKKA